MTARKACLPVEVAISVHCKGFGDLIETPIGTFRIEQPSFSSDPLLIMDHQIANLSCGKLKNQSKLTPVDGKLQHGQLQLTHIVVGQISAIVSEHYYPMQHTKVTTNDGVYRLPGHGHFYRTLLLLNGKKVISVKCND